jgi:outer membrane biosynthesis protein TonB
LLHVTALAALLIHEWRTSSPGAPSKPIPVNLVSAPERPAADQVEASPRADLPLDEGTAASGKAELADTTIAPGPALPHSKRIRPTIGGTIGKRRVQAAEPSAVYTVLVDTAGNIRDVALTRSSGVRSFDEAGKKMIYDGMALPWSSQEMSALRVTICFSREGR